VRRSDELPLWLDDCWDAEREQVRPQRSKGLGEQIAMQGGPRSGSCSTASFSNSLGHPRRLLRIKKGRSDTAWNEVKSAGR